MTQAQAEILFPRSVAETDESEQDREARLHAVLLRHIADAADEVGRKQVCYGLDLSEQLLGKQLKEVEEKRPSYKLLAYLLKHQQSGRLARWLLADYAGFLPPQRVARLSPEQALAAIVAMAMSGEMGNAAKEKVVDIYSKTKRPAGEP